MTRDQHPNDRIESILRDCLERAEGEWSSAVQDACVAHPELASRIRGRFEALQSFGMVGTAPAPAISRFGPFRLIRPLGSGSTATVYLAEREGADAPVALKLLRQDLLQSSTAVQRFQREVALASRIDHPGICRVLGTGSIDGIPYIAMTPVAGETLARRIEAAAGDGAPRIRPEMERLVRIIEKVARTLHVAHGHGLVHRDIKPSNIMIRADDDPVLMDLGLAADAEAEQSLTLSGTLLGTPIYMSPEMISAERKADVRSDVYSLGVTLFEVLSSRPPWKAPTREALFHQVLHGSAPSLSRANPHVDRDLALVVSTAMARDARLRYDSAEALADDLTRWCRGDRLSVRHPTVPRRAARWIVHNRLVTAFLIVLVLGLVAIGGVYLQTRSVLSRASALALCSAAAQERRSDPELAVLLTRTAVERDPNAVTVSELHAAMAALHTFEEVPAAEATLDERFPGGFGTCSPLPEGSGITGTVLDRSPDGSLVLARSEGDKTRVTVWDVDAARPLVVLDGHEEAVSCAWFSPAGDLVLTASSDQTARVWDLEGHERHRLPRHGCIVQAARFSPDGELIVTGGGDAVTRLFDSTGHPLTQFFGHGGFIEQVAISADRHFVATRSEDDTRRIWNLQAPVTLVAAGQGKPLRAGTICSEGTLITQDLDRSISFHETSGARIAAPPEFDGAISLLTTAGDAAISRRPESPDWSLRSLDGESLGHVDSLRGPIRGAAWRGSVLVTAGGQRLTWWHRGRDDRWQPDRDLDVGSAIICLDIHPEGRLVACGCEHGLMRIYGAEDAPVAEARHEKWVWTVRFSPDGRHLLSASRDNTARVHDLRGNEVLRLTGHGGTVLCASYSPDGDLIATASVDRTVRLWRSDGELLAILRGHTGQVRHVAFSPDGHRLISSSMDTTARVWMPYTEDLLDAARSAVQRGFTADERTRYAQILEP